MTKSEQDLFKTFLNIRITYSRIEFKEIDELLEKEKEIDSLIGSLRKVGLRPTTDTT